jgi:hypothetical protein
MDKESKLINEIYRKNVLKENQKGAIWGSGAPSPTPVKEPPTTTPAPKTPQRENPNPFAPRPGRTNQPMPQPKNQTLGQKIKKIL